MTSQCIEAGVAAPDFEQDRLSLVAWPVRSSRTSTGVEHSVVADRDHHGLRLTKPNSGPLVTPRTAEPSRAYVPTGQRESTSERQAGTPDRSRNAHCLVSPGESGR